MHKSRPTDGQELRDVQNVRDRTRNPQTPFFGPPCRHTSIGRRGSALDRIVEAELCCAADRFHIRTSDINQIVIRTNQLLLGLILPLLLIAVGLIGFGKRTGLTAM